MNDWRSAEAHDVRTGDVITTPWTRNGNFLTVDYPTRERFTSPEGWTGDVIRFTGTDNLGRHVKGGWSQKADSRVYIANRAIPFDMNTFGLVLTASADSNP